jgi:hypothetical protein
LLSEDIIDVSATINCGVLFQEAQVDERNVNSGSVISNFAVPQDKE